MARKIRARATARELRRKTTPTEKLLWERLRLNQIDGLQFRQQHPIGPYIVDFCCYRAGLVVEIDGEIHEQQREYDSERDDYLTSLGYTVLRFSTDRVLNRLHHVIAEIREACSPSPAHGGGGWGVGDPPQHPSRADTVAGDLPHCPPQSDTMSRDLPQYLPQTDAVVEGFPPQPAH